MATPVASPVRSTLMLALAAGVPCVVGAMARGQDGGAAPAATQEAPAATAPASATCTVTDAGADPRAVRRYAPTVGDASRFEFTVRNSQQMTMPDNAAPEMSMPPITFVSATTVSSVADGVIAADLVFESVSVGDDPVMGPQIEQMIRPMVGMGGTMKVSDRGEDMGFTLGADAQALGPGAAMVAAVANSLRGVVATLPVEAVGAGATWVSVEQQPDDQGILVTQTITHTLRKLEGDAFEITLVLKQSADPQVLPSPPTMPGATLRLESLVGEGTATVSGRFGSVMPLSLSLELRTTTDLSFKQGEVSQRLSRTMKTVAEGRTLPAAE